MNPQTTREGACTQACWAALALALGLLCACGGADVDAGPAYVLSVHPAPGSPICEGWGITLAFNRDPGLVESPHCAPDPAQQTGAKRVFRAGGPPVEFTWGAGDSLTVDYEFMSCHSPPAVLQEAFPDPWETADLDALVADGIILTFDKELAGEGEERQPDFVVSGPDGWEWEPPVKVAGAVIALGPPPPGLFEHGATYRVLGEVTDAQGNSTMVDFDFTVAPEE